eukprot:2707266-Prorocentrum_lima.AAC.1
MPWSCAAVLSAVAGGTAAASGNVCVRGTLRLVSSPWVPITVTLSAAIRMDVVTGASVKSRRMHSHVGL